LLFLGITVVSIAVLLSVAVLLTWGAIRTLRAFVRNFWPHS
jgi:hypothetical protein